MNAQKAQQSESLTQIFRRFDGGAIVKKLITDNLSHYNLISDMPLTPVHAKHIKRIVSPFPPGRRPVRPEAG